MSNSSLLFMLIISVISGIYFFWGGDHIPRMPLTPAGIPVQVMLVGDSGVGKTCLLVRFKDGAFLAGSFISTVGIDFRVSLNHESQTKTNINQFPAHMHFHTHFQIVLFLNGAIF